MLAVGAGRSCLDIFFLSPQYHLFTVSLSLGDGLIQTEILSQKAFKPKTTNQPMAYVKNGHTLEIKEVMMSPTELDGRYTNSTPDISIKF